MNKLEEMDKLLETHNLLRLSQEETQNLNRPITTNEIEAVIKKFPRSKSHGPNGFTGEFYQTLKEELTFVLLKLFLTFQTKGRLLSSFYEAEIILVLK